MNNTETIQICLSVRRVFNVQSLMRPIKLESPDSVNSPFRRGCSRMLLEAGLVEAAADWVGAAGNEVRQWFFKEAGSYARSPCFKKADTN